MSIPEITVLLPVYNGERYLKETIQSILDQTFRDFELLIVDDGSTDNSADIIDSFDDDRIRVLKNPQRLKLSGALNRGIQEARGEFVARMDADDIALPDRLQTQVSYLQAHPETGICGTAIEVFGKGRSRADVYPHDTDQIRCYALFDCPFCHPTVMFRRDVFLEHNLTYDGEYYPTEDYELWARAIELFPCVNLDQVLLRYRIHDQSMTGSDWGAMDLQATRVIRPLLETLGMGASEEQLRFHRNIGRGRSCQLTSYAELNQAEMWLNRLLQKNREVGVYDSQALAEIVSIIWYRVCFNSSVLGFNVASRFISNKSLSRGKKRIEHFFMILLSIVKNKVVPTTPSDP